MIAAIPSAQKRTGAYYTPSALAKFLAGWAIRQPDDRILDPACGEAVFLESAVKRLRELGAGPGPGQIAGVERDPEAARLSAEAVPPAAVEVGNFFDRDPQGDRFSVVVGNPPYIRYHYFDADRARALARAAQEGVQLSALTSSWAPFLVHASTFLSAEGRLAFVLPGELLATDYAAPVRDWLLRRFRTVDVLTFEKRVFPGAMVDAVLLLAEGAGPGDLRVSRLSSVEALSGFELNGDSVLADGKWTRGLLAPATMSAFDEAAACMQRLGDLATVDIGLVTGANKFFLLTNAAVKEFDLDRSHLRRLVACGSQMPRHSLAMSEWRELLRRGETAWLFAPSSDSGNAGRYIQDGELRGLHRSYKCRIRKPWWRMKLPGPPDLILSYMANHAPRLVANEAGVLTTNLLHNVRITAPGLEPSALALAWPNSATLLSAELTGRAYGGGVLKLETREAERVLIPRLTDAINAELRRRASAIDALLSVNLVEAAADLVDPVVLSAVDPGLRLALRRGWLDLRDRRRRRSAPADARA